MSTVGILRPVVLDASVAAKWLLRDEEDLERADALLQAHYSGTVNLIAPRQIEVEVANSVRRAVLKRRVSRSRGTELFTEWLATSTARLELMPTAPLLSEAWRMSFQYGVTLFDGLYIALADDLAIDLVVADERLLRSPAGSLPFVHALGSFVVDGGG